MGGFELIVALAYHLGWSQRTADVICRAVDALKETEAFEANRGQGEHEGKRQGREIHRALQPTSRGEKGVRLTSLQFKKTFLGGVLLTALGDL